MAAVVHPVVKNAHNQDAGLVRLEEDAVTTAGGHLDIRLEVVTSARDHRATGQALHRVTEGVHVLGRLVPPPRPNGVATNRGKIRPGDLGEVESLHKPANSASISSSVSS